MEQTGEIKFDVKMTVGLMYDFLLYHTYTSMAGLISTILGILILGFGVNLQTQGTTSPLIYYIAGGVFAFSVITSLIYFLVTRKK